MSGTFAGACLEPKSHGEYRHFRWCDLVPENMDFRRAVSEIRKGYQDLHLTFETPELAECKILSDQVKYALKEFLWGFGIKLFLPTGSVGVALRAPV